LHHHTWQVTLKEFGYDFSKEEFLATFGQNSLTTLAILFGEKPDLAYARQIIDRKELLFQRMAAEQLELLPAVRDWLTRFQSLGMKQVVASSAPIGNIDVTVDALNIRRYFAAHVAGADLPPKPNPDIFLKAAQAVSVPPARCVVIEDAVHGLQGAHAAGMKCIAVTTTNPAEALHQADLVLKDLTGLSEEAFFGLFE
jgi:HAD superfamily hydrolase (TIGR01509 family)